MFTKVVGEHVFIAPTLVTHSCWLDSNPPMQFLWLQFTKTSTVLHNAYTMAVGFENSQRTWFFSLHRSSKLLTTLVMYTSYLESLSRVSEQEKDHCTSLKTFMAWDIINVLKTMYSSVFPTCDWGTFQRALHLLKAYFNHMTRLNMAVSTYCNHEIYSYFNCCWHVLHAQLE